MNLDLRWVSCFADVPAPRFDGALAFWSGVTGGVPGIPSGKHGEFVPLEPHVGDRYLWLQRIGSGAGGWHLDLHVPDVVAGARRAAELGAEVVRPGDPLIALESPAGIPFCLIREDRAERQRPAPPTWAGVGRSLADQVCLDLPVAVHDAECAFWAALTGWPYVRTDAPEFSRLNPPPTLPIQLLLQRLGNDDTGGVRAHLDMSADDPAAEVARHISLGAAFVRDGRGWTVMRDPAGLTYCVTHRRPATR